MKSDKKIVFGICEPKEIRGLPKDFDCLLKMNADAPAVVVCVSKKTERTFMIEEREDCWIIDREVSREVVVQ